MLEINLIQHFFFCSYKSVIYFTFFWMRILLMICFFSFLSQWCNFCQHLCKIKSCKFMLYWFYVLDNFSMSAVCFSSTISSNFEQDFHFWNISVFGGRFLFFVQEFLQSWTRFPLFVEDFCFLSNISAIC